MLSQVCRVMLIIVEERSRVSVIVNITKEVEKVSWDLLHIRQKLFWISVKVFVDLSFGLNLVTIRGSWLVDDWSLMALLWDDLLDPFFNDCSFSWLEAKRESKELIHSLGRVRLNHVFIPEEVKRNAFLFGIVKPPSVKSSPFVDLIFNKLLPGVFELKVELLLDALGMSPCEQERKLWC